MLKMKRRHKVKEETAKSKRKLRRKRKKKMKEKPMKEKKRKKQSNRVTKASFSEPKDKGRSFMIIRIIWSFQSLALPVICSVRRPKVQAKTIQMSRSARVLTNFRSPFSPCPDSYLANVPIETVGP